jgi:mRNA interferase RelE/StbE
LAERLPPEVAAAAELIIGPLLDHPRRVGKPLGEELTGTYSSRLARDWRILYEIDETRRVVLVLDILRRSVAYRRR